MPFLRLLMRLFSRDSVQPAAATLPAVHTKHVIPHSLPARLTWAVLPGWILTLMAVLWQPETCLHTLAVTDELLLRVKLEYKADRTEALLEDKCIDFASDYWIRSGSYLYYEKPLRSGSVVSLMNGFRVPDSWGNRSAGASFSIRITAEIMPYYTVEQKEMNGTSAKAVLEEYEAVSGKEIPFRNGKTVLPGQYVSKIVRVRVDGEKKPGLEVQGIKAPEQGGYAGVSGNEKQAPGTEHDVSRKAVTSDTGKMALWLVLAAISLAGIMVSAIWMVKK